MSKPNNPLLFDMRQDHDGATYYQTETTLRDLFAAAALTGICAQGPTMLKALQATSDGDISEIIAEQAYRQADDMLKERAK